MTTDYCTTDIDAAHRFDYWSDVVRQHCLPAASRLLAQDAFDGRLSFSLAGTVAISTMAAPLLHRWSRQAPHIRQRDDDDLWIGYMRAGQGALDQSGRHARLNSGDLFLYDSARPFDCALTAQCLHLCRIPRHALLQRYPDAERMTVRILDSSKPTLLQLRTMIEQAVCIDFDQVRPATAAQFGTTLLDLLGLALKFQQDRQACAAERDLHGRIAAYIRRHFMDPALTLQTLARAHGISVRTVTRAFARQPQGAMGLASRKLRLRYLRRPGARKCQHMDDWPENRPQGAPTWRKAHCITLNCWKRAGASSRASSPAWKSPRRCCSASRHWSRNCTATPA